MARCVHQKVVITRANCQAMHAPSAISPRKSVTSLLGVIIYLRNRVVLSAIVLPPGGQQIGFGTDDLLPLISASTNRTCRCCGDLQFR
jgi:hypothetical protein